MKRTTKLILTIALLLISLLVIGLSINHQFNLSKDKYTLECKPLRVYQAVRNGSKGRQYQDWWVIAQVKKYNRITELRLSPSGYYKAEEAIAQNKEISYRFSQREINQLQGISTKNDNLIEILLFLGIILSLLSAVYILTEI